MAYKDKQKQNAFQTAWRKDWRKKWYEEHGPCTECGSDRNLKIFSHTTSIPKNLWTLSLERREAILAECIVLCSSCHRLASIKRFRERQASIPATALPLVGSIAERLSTDQRSVRFDPSNISVEGKEVVITVTIKVV